jgi:hypothetical protein
MARKTEAMLTATQARDPRQPDNVDIAAPHALLAFAEAGALLGRRRLLIKIFVGPVRYIQSEMPRP